MSNCSTGDIRLTGNELQQTGFGRLEICFNKAWGSVCRDDWQNSASLVACQQLGYPQNSGNEV